MCPSFTLMMMLLSRWICEWLEAKALLETILDHLFVIFLSNFEREQKTSFAVTMEEMPQEPYITKNNDKCKLGKCNINWTHYLFSNQA